MQHKEACEMLEIDFIPIKGDNLKLTKQYRKMALKHHPDKNGNTPESNEHFQKINEAYNLLKNDLKEDQSQEDNNDYATNSQSIYLFVLKNFIKMVMEGNYVDIIPNIVYNILTSGKQISSKIFENLDKAVVLNIYLFLSKYKAILHLSDDIFEIIRQLVLDKYENVEIYKLNPSINDLINHNLYKLYVDGQLYLVPLWHYESYYDNSGCEIIVICVPELPDNIKIDDDNNLIVDIKLCGELTDMIINEIPFEFKIGENEYAINLSNLYMKKEQYYCFKGQGISKFNKNLYDVSDKTDIMIKISINTFGKGITKIENNGVKN